MDNCYGKSDRIPRELLHNNDRLSNKHIQTLSFLQEIVDENAQLKQKVEELETEREKCQEIHTLAEESQLRIKDIEENCLKRADEVNQMLADQHRTEMMQVLDEKMEMERELKEEILKLRHELESLQRTTLVLEKDSEWRNEKQALESRVTELELLAEGLQIEADDRKSEHNTLQTSLNQSKAQNSQLHQLQDLRATNRSLTDELRETGQKNQEFAHRIGKLERELKHSSSEEEEHTKLMEALRSKSQKLQREKELARLKEADTKSQCESLASLNHSVQEEAGLLERDCARLLQELQELQQEHGRLSRHLHQGEDKAAFKEFLAVQTELKATREENEVLRRKVQALSCSLPHLKDDPFSSSSSSQGQSRPASKSKEKKKLPSISSSHGEASPTP